MNLMLLKDASLTHGAEPLLDESKLTLESGERLGLIGRNGSGKSSLLKVLAGQVTLDSGEIQQKQDLRVVLMPQIPDFKANESVLEAVSSGVRETRQLIEDYLTGQGDLNALQTRIEAGGGWNWEQRVEHTLHSLELEDLRAVPVQTLSGGQRKRVAFARAWVQQPDVLLLDEPTNHLDLEAIVWLEEALQGFSGSAIIVSHDRAFLDSVVTRIVELDRGQLRSYPGNFASYVQRKTEQLEQEAAEYSRADKLLGQEEQWMRQGVEARRTRARTRVKRLQDLRAARAARRDHLGQVRMAVDARVAGYQGRRIVEMENVQLSFGAHRVINDFSCTILRGDKVGLIGPNGAGKTSLLKLMLGQTQPDAGQVWLSDTLQIAYFDQMREGLDEQATLMDFISPGSEWIEIGEQRMHVMHYLCNFLFSSQRARSPVHSLSGGEKSRLLLARLFARPANVLVLDEPTNDLDIDTLELLEDLLQEYSGTVFLVSHDRRFMDNVVTSTIAWESPGEWREYVGGLTDWLQQSGWLERQAEPVREDKGRGSAPSPLLEGARTVQDPGAPADAGKRRKLSYREQRELDKLPEQIDALEKEQAGILDRIGDGSLYATDVEQALVLQRRHDEIEQELTQALERWEALEERR